MSGSFSSNTHSSARGNLDDHPLSPAKLDEIGYHSFSCLGVPFHVKKRYTFIRELGIGAYGCVALAKDSILDCNVAIKKVTRVFERDVLARRALREVVILRHIGMCDNVTALLDFDATFIEFSEIYLVLSASEADLSQIIRSGQTLSDAHLQYFVAQILRGTRYMHAANIIHRDLKPGNLLVNADCALRLCDFGLARAYAQPSSTSSSRTECDNDRSPSRQSADENSSSDTDSSVHEGQGDASHDRMTPESPSFDTPLKISSSTELKCKNRRLEFPGGPLTEYVATRWYRAPEVMLCFREGYGPEIDMWSVGCILAELIAGKPIFAGKDYVDQIARINNILGSPPDSVMDKIGSEKAKTYIRSLPRMPAVPFHKLYPSASPDALDLLSKLLVWDPDQRLTAAEALQHPWLKAYHETNARWQRPPPFDKFADVEFIRSLREFRYGLQREADEVALEIEALEREEEEANAAQDDIQEDHTDKEDSGNGQRAGAEKSSAAPSDAETNDSSASSCSASSRSCHLPASSASSGSSLHTPGSSPTSADETEPASPSVENICGVTFRKATELGEGKALKQHPYFQLGHEDEGRRFSEIVDQRSKNEQFHQFVSESANGSLSNEALIQRRRTISFDVFMPNEVLTVGKVLVDIPHLEGQPSSRKRSATVTGSSGLLTESSSVKQGTTPSSSYPASQQNVRTTSSLSGSGRSASGVGGSTPSLAQGFLNHTSITPSSSASLTSQSGSRQSKQLVLIQDDLVQSAAGLIQEVIARNVERSAPTVLLSALRDPSVYVADQSHPLVSILDASRSCSAYEHLMGPSNSMSLKSITSLEEKLSLLIEQSGGHSRVTVVLDSLNMIMEQSDEGFEGAYSLVKTLLGKLNSHSRLLVALQSESPTASASLLTSLSTPLVWKPKRGAGVDHSSSSGTTLMVRLHSPSVLRYIHKTYGLRPPSSSTAVARAIAAESLATLENELSGKDVPEEECVADPRFWDILRSVSNRGAFGIAGYEMGGGTNGWWVEAGGNECECIFKGGPRGPNGLGATSGPVGSTITLEDLAGNNSSDPADQNRNVGSSGWGFIECRFQGRSGKIYEELVGCSVDVEAAHKRLRLRKLDMTDRRARTVPQTQVHQGAGQEQLSSSVPNSSPSLAASSDPHTSLVSNLTFNVGETAAQKARREEVPLPYAFHQNQGGLASGFNNPPTMRGTTGNSTIFFEPESGDDEDDEDPDDDLDL